MYVPVRSISILYFTLIATSKDRGSTILLSFVVKLSIRGDASNGVIPKSHFLKIHQVIQKFI
jgi:hypothetical protein